MKYRRLWWAGNVVNGEGKECIQNFLMKALGKLSLERLRRWLGDNTEINFKEANSWDEQCTELA